MCCFDFYIIFFRFFWLSAVTTYITAILMQRWFCICMSVCRYSKISRFVNFCFCMHINILQMIIVMLIFENVKKNFWGRNTCRRSTASTNHRWVSGKLTRRSKHRLLFLNCDTKNEVSYLKIKYLKIYILTMFEKLSYLCKSALSRELRIGVQRRLENCVAMLQFEIIPPQKLTRKKSSSFTVTRWKKLMLLSLTEYSGVPVNTDKVIG